MNADNLKMYTKLSPKIRIIMLNNLVIYVTTFLVCSKTLSKHRKYRKYWKMRRQVTSDMGMWNELRRNLGA